MPISKAIAWEPAGDGGWQTSIDLPALRAGDIVAPSLSVLERGSYRFRFTLTARGKDYPLRPVPSDAEEGRAKDPTDSVIRTAIDCYHVDANLGSCRLLVRFEGDGKPDRYLLAVSTRPVDLEPMPLEVPSPVRAPPPPRHSQMLENPRIAARICSPVSTAMVIAMRRRDVDYGDVVAACLDPVTGMYGLWPLAIRAASRYGLIGAVELIDGWQPVLPFLVRGMPVVASIRYGENALPGAPQRSTAGHLVVVHGIDATTVHVNDPAAPDHGSVYRRYPIEAFSRAWFRHRGAAYMLTP